MDYGLDKKTNTLKTFNTIFIISWLLVACFPFIWTFWGSFKVRADFFSRSDWWYAISAFNTLIETGEKFTTNAYHEAWFEGEFWKASKNTIIEVFKKKNVIDGKVLYSNSDRMDINNILKFY